VDPLTITTLTPSDLQQSLQSNGLDALGLTTLALSTRWADATPSANDYDAAELTLNVSALRAPWRGIRDFAFSPVSGSLTAAVSNTDTMLTVSAGDLFPNPSGGSILLTLSDQAGTKFEVVECSARSGDSFTISRAADDTTAQSFAIGDRVSLRLAAGARTSSFIGADGEALIGTCAVYRLHPAALLRLEALMKERYTSGADPMVLPVPWSMVVRDAQGFTTSRWFEPDEAMTGISGKISFHDRRGLIVDPLYVASLMADLQAWLAGLTGKTSTASVSGTGGVQTIAALGSSTLLHFVDLHGNNYSPAFSQATLVTKNGGGTQTGTVPTSGLLTLASGDGVAAADSDGGRLRWGWATNGVLARTQLAPPALPTGTPTPSLSQKFYRVAVVDVVWALLGNRTADAALDIPGDDQTIPTDLIPKVRDQIVIDYLTDGLDTLAEASTVLSRASQNMVVAVSPALDGTMTVPTQLGAAGHWPQFPAPNSNAGFPSPPASAKDGITAAWGAGSDVVVTIAADKVPDGAHVRLYPQVYVTIPAITQEPSFLRGNGGASIAQAATATQIALPNPFQLASGQAKPTPANLTVDIVVAPRNGNRKMWGAVSIPVTAGPAAVPADPFAGTNALTAMVPMFESVAPSPLFGIPNTMPPPSSTPTSVIQLVRAYASESQPRQGPRLPTMARFDSVFVTGTAGGTPTGTLLWEAVLTGGRWARETRSALHVMGNPGNPAGPDLHAPGLHVTGALAYDLARHAMRRVQPIMPLPSTPGATPGWVIAMDGDNFNEPTDSLPTNTGIGVLLETVAAACETPELSVVPPPAPGTNAQGVINSIASAIGLSPPTFTATNDARIIGEIRRECVVSAAGSRDAVWSLRRVLREARELIYVESAQFARTARPDTTTTHEVPDLIAEIVTSLEKHPNLKVIVCTPRESDFAANYPGWSREHYKARLEAVTTLLAAEPGRIAVFHPVGFPGRTAFIRTTSVIVDDVWALVGATHFRRRGMTFDGSAAIASFDRQMSSGYSKKVREYRRNLMAAKMAIAAPGASTPSADWLRLGQPESAFQLVTAWLSQGGLGFIQPLWTGPADTSVLPATDDMADPNGADDGTYLGLFASLLAEAGH
jgi:hypothetical protein